MYKKPNFTINFVLIIILIFLAKAASAQFLADFNTEAGKRYEYTQESQPEKYGYRYDVYEQAKELIFEQLEIITGDEETRYIIVPGDTLTISYSDRKERAGAVYKVSAEGFIFLPLIGKVQISGLNRRDARAKLNHLFGVYIRRPEVKLTVNTSGRFMVLGEVGTPGLQMLSPNLTVFEAIMKAGGYDKDSAKLSSVVLMRGGLGEPILKRLNLKKMVKKGDRTDNIHVKPGDLIFVPKTFISSMTKFKDIVYNYVNTYYGFGRLPAPAPVQEKEIILYDR